MIKFSIMQGAASPSIKGKIIKNHIILILGLSKEAQDCPIYTWKSFLEKV